MTRKLLVFLLAVIMLPVCGFAELSKAPMVSEIPVALECVSALLCEIDSGQVIFELNADEKREVASVTKVMTILLTIEAIEEGRIALEDIVSISASASGMGGSQILLDTGESQTVSQLLKSVIVGSANDSAVAIAEYIYGSEDLFVSYMNERCQELGMTNTVFQNCTGLPDDKQYTTARDVSIMASELFKKDIYYEYSKLWLEDFDHFDGRVTQLTNTNKLIRLYDDCDGGKTGSTNAAGYCIAATAKRSGMRLLATVLGSDTSSERFDTVSDMFDYGFANYRLYPVAEKGTPIKGEMPVEGGDKDSVKLELDGNLTLLINKGEEKLIELSPSIPEKLTAPVNPGQTVGTIDVTRDGVNVASLPVVAAEGVEATGIKYVIIRILSNWSL